MRFTQLAYWAAAAFSFFDLIVAETVPDGQQLESRQNPQFVGYLITTQTDADPAVQFHLSNGNNPDSFSFSNRGKPVLRSTVGTRAIRDSYLTTNSARSEWYIIATDQDVNAPGFSWYNAVTKGSRGIVIWKSNNLVDWSAPRLVILEDASSGMLWAPSAVWDEPTKQWYVFWSTRKYANNDPNHTGPASNDHIRYTTTKDFVTFAPAKDYIVANIPILDQEFLYLGKPGHYARFIKDEPVNQVYQEVTTGGIFGQWRRIPGYVRLEAPREGTASFADNIVPGLYHIFLDDYTEYRSYRSTGDIATNPGWTPSGGGGFPRGLKHGSVTPLTRAEYDRFAARYPA